MKITHGLTLTLALGLLVLPLVAPAGGLAQLATGGTGLAAIQAPVLGPYLDIWSGDGVNNWGATTAYNRLHGEYLVVWTNERSGSMDIYARRVHSDGRVEPWFCVVTGPGKSYYAPAVAYSPAQDQYLIVYTHDVTTTNSDVWATAVSWNGGWISNPFPIRQEAEHQQNPAVAYNSQDDEFLVVYENGWTGSNFNDIAARRVRASDRALLSWRNIASGAPDLRTRPDVAYNGARNEYLIAYTYQPGSYLNPGDVYGKVTSADMGTLSSEISIRTGAGCQGEVSAAAGPDEYLVVWQDRVCGTNEANIYARRVNGAGEPQGPAAGFPLTIAPAYQTLPSVAYGAGCGYLVAWRHVPGTPQVWDVYGRYVRPGHDAAADAEFTISNIPSWDTGEDVACAPSGDCLVVMDNYAGGASDLEIQGRMVALHHVYLPLVVRAYH